MKRRTLLKLIGMAPVAAAVPAMGLPRPDNVKETAKSTVDMDYESLNSDLQNYMQWLEGASRASIGAIKFYV